MISRNYRKRICMKDRKCFFFFFSSHTFAQTSFNPSHSTGRGGNANITSKHEPTVEHHEHLKTDFQSTGRGGTGNIVKETTPS